MRFLSRLVLLITLPLLVHPSVGLAQDNTTVVLRAARMLDVVQGRMVEPGIVAIVNGRISAVGQLPPDAQVIDLGDVTLLPGFIDLHTHLGGDIDADSFNRAVRETDVDAAFRATSNARKTVLAGFTTVRDFGGEVTVALARAVETGMVTGPHVFPSRNPIGITGGHCDVTGLRPGSARDHMEGRYRRWSRRGRQGGPLPDQAWRQGH